MKTPQKNVVFVCTHGGAKSVIAASYFNRIMEEQQQEWRAVAAAAEDPYEAVPQPVQQFLKEEGFEVSAFQPRRLDRQELTESELVVVIGCAVETAASTQRQWEGVPQAADGVEASASAIRERVEDLAAELTGKKSTPTLSALVAYFLRLGTFGFGGPIALAGAMQRDLVEKRRWVTQAEYLNGLALAQLAPGPLAAQLAIYLGWVRGGVAGATLVAFSFVLPSFLMVLAISAAYVRFGGLQWMQSAFYGIGAAVIAIILRSAWKLARMTLARDRLLWSIFAVNAAATATLRAEVVTLILACGFVSWFVRARPHPAQAACVAPSLAQIFWFFAKAGAFVFGSGLAIVPFLYGGIVQEHGWLNDQQFLDAVAVAMITPGPVVITVAFIGYLVAGYAGALVAAIGVFLPCYLFVIIPAPYYARFADDSRLRAFVSGVTAATTGAIAGAVFVLGERAIVDPVTMLIFAGTLACLIWLKRIPEPVWITIVGLASVLAAWA